MGTVRPIQEGNKHKKKLIKIDFSLDCIPQ